MNPFETVSRLAILRQTSFDLLEKTSHCTKANDAETFLRMAMDISQVADRLEADSKVESTWIYLHMVKNFDYSPEFSEYTAFCLRNKLQALHHDDFQTSLAWLHARA